MESNKFFFMNSMEFIVNKSLDFSFMTYFYTIFSTSIFIFLIMLNPTNSFFKKNIVKWGLNLFMTQMVLWTYAMMQFIPNNIGKNSLFFFEKGLFSCFMNSTTMLFAYINMLVMVFVYVNYCSSKMDFNSNFTFFSKTINFKKKQDCYFISALCTLHIMIMSLFMTTNIVLFFVLFEGSILPLLYMMMVMAKRSNKFSAKAYLLFFTMVSGIPFIFTIIWLMDITGSKEIFVIAKLITEYIYSHKLSSTQLYYFFIGFFMPFIVKGAIFPFHGWLPEAHVEAPTEGSMILSGIMLKLGFFGLIKFNTLFFGAIFFKMGFYLLALIVLGMGPPLAALFSSTDVKKVIAFYSIVHMHMGLAGILASQALATEASLFMNMSHAITSAGLFGSVGLMFERLKGRNIGEISGLHSVMPSWTASFFVLLLSNAGIPGTISFAPEIGLLSGMIDMFPVETIILFVAASIASVRSFLLFNQVCMGQSFIGGQNSINNTNRWMYYSSQRLIEPGAIESMAFKALAFSSIFFGIWATPIMSMLPKLF